MMSKFYVQSGNASWIVQSQDAEGAALWLLHQSLVRLQSVADLEANSSDDETRFYILDGLAQLAPEIFVSQIGLGRWEAGRFDTGQLFDNWRSLAGSLSSLFDPFRQK